MLTRAEIAALWGCEPDTVRSRIGSPDGYEMRDGANARKRVALYSAERVAEWEAGKRGSLPGLPSREEILDMRERGVSREAMATATGLSVSRIKRLLAAYRAPSARKAVKRPPAAKIPPACLDDEDGMTLLEKARRRLALRIPPIELGECRRTRRYTLNGRPVARVADVLAAAGLSERDAPEPAFRRIEGGMAASPITWC